MSIGCFRSSSTTRPGAHHPRDELTLIQLGSAALLPAANRHRDPSPPAPEVGLIHAAEWCLVADAEFVVTPIITIRFMFTPRLRHPLAGHKWQPSTRRNFFLISKIVPDQCA